MGAVDGVFRIADLGCATGMNTLLVADTIVRSLKLTFTRLSIDMPEFQLYFAELSSNDFKTLLLTLPPLRSDETRRSDEIRHDDRQIDLYHNTTQL